MARIERGQIWAWPNQSVARIERGQIRAWPELSMAKSERGQYWAWSEMSVGVSNSLSPKAMNGYGGQIWAFQAQIGAWPELSVRISSCPRRREVEGEVRSVKWELSEVRRSPKKCWSEEKSERRSESCSRCREVQWSSLLGCEVAVRTNHRYAEGRGRSLIGLLHCSRSGQRRRVKCLPTHTYQSNPTAVMNLAQY